MKNATFRRRLGAMLYDGLLVLALLFLGSLPFIALEGGESVAPGTLVYQLTMLAIIYGFFTWFWSRHGRTLGMQSWGLRIEDEHGRKPSLARCTLRFFGALLSWLPAGLGFLWQVVDPRGLSWHDRLSGTRIHHYPREPRDA